MSDDKKIIVDDDWKSQVEREKEELAETEAQQGPQDQLPEATLLNHVASLATQTMVMLGLVEHPVIGKRMYDGEQARFIIDTIVMLKEKTADHQTPEEKDYLERMLPELQMTFVEVSKAVEQAQADEAAGVLNPEAGKPSIETP